MTALCLHLPEELLKDCEEATQKLGMSRSRFIRIAISHEIDRIRQETAVDKILHTYKVMENIPKYQRNTQNFKDWLKDEILNEELDKIDFDGEDWWTK